MNYYREPSTGLVYAYDDEQVAEGLVKEGLVPMTEQEIYDHLNPPVVEPL